MKTLLLAALVMVSIFSSPLSALVILSPNGGEMLASGTTFLIQWDPTGEPAPTQVKYSISADGGGMWVEMGMVENTGSHEWTVPSYTSETYLLMIEDPVDGSVWDISDGPFVVYDCPRQVSGDLNGDCYVDLQDIAVLSAGWLGCANPYDPNCPCIEPYADCDGLPANACEVNLLTDPVHCGECGISCALAHAYTSCVDGSCVFNGCHPGYYDCDGDSANGCEGQLIDPYEDNDTLGTAFYLGIIDENMTMTYAGQQIVPPGDEDWYRVYLKEGPHTCIPWTDQDYVIRIRMTPPQGAACVDYDVYLYTDGGGLVDSSNYGGCTPEEIVYVWDGECGTDDSRYFRIKVVGFGSAWSCSGYTMSIYMYQQ
jgi:hypothetical protein